MRSSDVLRSPVVSHRLALLLVLGLGACTDAPPEMPTPAAADTVVVDLTVPDGVAVPEGMTYVPGGTTRIGVLPGEGGMPHEKPVFAAEV